MCNWLDVTPAGFYAWVKRKESARKKEDKELLKRITEIFEASDGRYGSPRVFKALKKEGYAVGEKRVERLMREAGLKARAFRMTRRQPGLKAFKSKGENILMKMDMPTHVDQVWVADITYIKVNERWHYLATVMDLFSRRILGWSLGEQRSQELTISALGYALKNRGYPTGVVFHTDRGIEYTAKDFQKHLRKYDFIHSLNRPGYCTDNAFMESFFHSLKTELIRGNTYTKIGELRRELSRYINNFYNSVRLHSGLDYLSPIEYELRLP